MLLRHSHAVGAGRSASRSCCPIVKDALYHSVHCVGPVRRSSGFALGDRHVVRVLEEPPTKKSAAEAFIEEVQQSIPQPDGDDQEQSVVAASISDLQQQVTSIEQQVSAYRSCPANARQATASNNALDTVQSNASVSAVPYRMQIP